jgi:arylsulfatase A
MNLWFNAPHAPLNIPITNEEEVLTSLGYGSASTPYTQDWNKHTKNEKYNHLSQLQTYRAFLKQKDTELGKLVQKLKELNIFEETMIVYTSDNGAEDEYKYYGTVGDSGPFRGRKRSNYNGGHRMPFIISWPNAIPNPVTFSEPITSSDWLKTVVSLVSNKNSNEIENNGAKYTQDFSCLFFEYDSTCQDLLRDRTLLFDSFDKQTSTCFDSSPRYAIRYADHKFYQNDRNANPKFQLFNVKNDPLELNDLSNTDLTLLSDMQQKFLDFIRNSDYYKDNVDDSWKNNDWNANNDFFVWTKSSESNMLAQCN